MIDLVTSPIAIEIKPRLYKVTVNGEQVGLLIQTEKEWKPAGTTIALAVYKGGEAAKPWRTLGQALQGLEKAFNREHNWRQRN